MSKPLVLLGALLVTVCVLCLVCGAWAPEARLHVRDGVEYYMTTWHWHWHAPASIVCSLGVLAIMAAVCWLVIRRGLAAPQASTTAAPPINRRQFPRYACAWSVYYQVRGLPFERQAMCVNISEGGLQCVMRERWVRSTPLELRVEPPNAEPFVVHGTVRWMRVASKPLPLLGAGPQHRVGIRFEPERPAQIGGLLRLLLSSGGLTLA